MRHSTVKSTSTRGVVHAAGVLQDGLLAQLDAAALNSVLRPKMMGGWLLHGLLENVPLDFFVLFSSAGYLLGSLAKETMLLPMPSWMRWLTTEEPKVSRP